jgi:hypothetical protein
VSGCAGRAAHEDWAVTRPQSSARRCFSPQFTGRVWKNAVRSVVLSDREAAYAAAVEPNVSTFTQANPPPNYHPAAFIFALRRGHHEAARIRFIAGQRGSVAVRGARAAAGVAGFLAPQVLFITPFRDFGLERVLMLGSLGAIAAAVCSWLSGEKQNAALDAAAGSEHG